MRLPDLSGLSLAPTGSRATPCDWRFGNCVTFYLADDLFARHADLVRELGLTQESCKVIVVALNTGCDLQEAADALLEATKYKWSLNPTGYCDDISLMVYAL